MPVPQERDFLGSLNAIKKITESTCADKWDIMVETAIPAAGEALWLLLVPDPGEILENYLNPRSRRSQRKRGAAGTGQRQMTRYGQMRWWQKIGFPDLDQIIADRLPGADAIRGRKVGTAEKWLWQGIDVVDRVLWYWLLIEVGRTFVVEWGSGIVESRFCTNPMLSLFTGFGDVEPTSTNNPFWSDEGDVFVQTNNGWLIQGGGTLRRENDFIRVDGPVAATITGTIQEPGFPTKSPVRMRVVTSTGSTVIQIVESDTKELAQGDTFEFGVTFTALPFTSISFHLTTDGGFPGHGITSRSWNVTLFTNPFD